MFEVERYTDDKAAAWDSFVDSSRQGTFLFNRDYMDYHRDRFADHSLMIYNNGRLAAMLPANADGTTLWSHQGLTYGSLLTGVKTSANDVISIFNAINAFLASEGFKKVVYKPIPWIYQRVPAEEDLYALTNVCGAQLVVRNISSAIMLENPVKWRYGRRYDANKASKYGVIVSQDDSAYADFWRVLDDNLMATHHVKPVHSLEEITRLHRAFPDNIKLYVARYEGRVVGGSLIYVTPQVVHSQYISATPEGKHLHAVDAIFRRVLTEDFTDYKYFDFGMSNEDHGRYLNSNLIFQKEGFGGRGVCYDWYEYTIG